MSAHREQIVRLTPRELGELLKPLLLPGITVQRFRVSQPWDGEQVEILLRADEREDFRHRREGEEACLVPIQQVLHKGPQQ